MNLSNLKNVVKEFVNREEHGKKVKAKEVGKVMDALYKKEKKFKKKYASAKPGERKELKLKLKVVRAQIKKGKKLLKELDS